jgi:integrase
MLASLRIGEALALKWENIDFEKGALFVEQGLTEDVEFDNDLNIIGRKNIISSTKTCKEKKERDCKYLANSMRYLIFMLY